MPSLHSSRARRAALAAALVGLRGHCRSTTARRLRRRRQHVDLHDLPSGDAGRHRADHGRSHRRRLDDHERRPPWCRRSTSSRATCEVRYDADWKPLSLFIDANDTRPGEDAEDGRHRHDRPQRDDHRRRSDQIEPTRSTRASILLPNLVFAPYEAARRTASRVAARSEAAGLHRAARLGVRSRSATPVDEQIQTVEPDDQGAADAA